MKMDANDLRAMVREVLREALAGRSATQAAGAPQPVRIATDADLQAFVARLAAPGVIDQVRSGSLKFTLSAGTGSQAAPAQRPAAVTLTGVVSERALKTLAAGTLVRLGPGAVLTPLAREAGRRLGLTFERSAP